jgi:hypothetical protein
MYSVSFEEVSVASADAPQDLFNLLAAAGKPLIVHEVRIGNTDGETSEQWSILVHRGTTAGTGGSTPTPRPLDPSGAAAGFTARVNDDTTQATEGLILLADGFNVLNGWIWIPTPECRPMVAGSTRIVVELQTATVTTILLSGAMIVEEMG